MKTKTTKLWLDSTSWIPDCEAYVLCRTALESVERGLVPGEVLHPIKVQLTKTKARWHGRAEWWERDSQGKRWCRVLVRVGKPKHFPCDWTYRRFKDMPEMHVENYREALVGLAAHEIAHTLGYSGRKDGEMKCEMCSWDALDYYRKHREEIDAEITRYIATATARTQRAERKPTAEEKTAKNYQHLQQMLAQWQRRLKLAQGKVKKYTRSLKRAEKRLRTTLATCSKESAPLSALPTPVAASSTEPACALLPPSSGPSLPEPAQSLHLYPAESSLASQPAGSPVG